MNSLQQLSLDLAIQSTIILVLASGMCYCLCRSTAAIRHRLWMLTFLGLLALPLLASTVPSVRIPMAFGRVVMVPTVAEICENSRC